MIPQSEWDKYKQIINSFHDSANKQKLYWKKFIGGVNIHGEDITDNVANFQTIELEVLADYNNFRTWPINRSRQEGESDNQSLTVLINKKWLRDRGYLNASNNLGFDAQHDHFILAGIKYSCSGFTDVSQAKEEPLFMQVILERKEVATNSNEYNISP